MAFLVIALIEIFGAIGIILTYGIIRNVFTEQQKATYSSKMMVYERIRSGENFSYWEDSQKVRDVFDKIALQKYSDKFESTALTGKIEVDNKEYTLSCINYYSDQKFNISGTSYNDFTRGGNVVVVRSDEFPCETGDIINIGNTDYKVICASSSSLQAYTFLFPYNHSPQKAKYNSVYLIFNDIPSKQLSKDIKDELETGLGLDYPIREPKIPDLLVEQFNAVMLIGCVISMILIASNCITVYMYIIRRRKTWISVIKLCGCKNTVIVNILISEMMIVTCFCYGIGYGIAYKMLIPKLSKYYPLFDSVYNYKSYLLLFISFIAISLIIIIIRISSFVNNSVNEMRRRASE
ncbi:FtsX-like permease family protein [Ruminococcaceae bacterium FB2012]|nr:FtsX-like permease family protein [Ruminococcaceae bacterium FB2012]